MIKRLLHKNEWASYSPNVKFNWLELLILLVLSKGSSKPKDKPIPF